MENWGLITYRETALLIDASQSSSSTKQGVALVVGHEIAHMWFGNLVTPVSSFLCLPAKTAYVTNKARCKTCAAAVVLSFSRCHEMCLVLFISRYCTAVGVLYISRFDQ